MEVPNKVIKTEFEQFAIANIKKEPDIIEIDEEIFLNEISTPSKELIGPNIDESFVDAIVHDELVKEEYVFYDANELQFLPIQEVEEASKTSKNIGHTTNPPGSGLSKQSEQKKCFECYICRTQTENIVFLKWHLQERHHSLQSQRLQKQNMKKENMEKQTSKKRKLMENSKENELKKWKLKKQISKQQYLQESHQQGNQHERGHSLLIATTENIFECSYCRRKFNTMQRCQNHERIHTNKKPFKCPVCLKYYNTKDSMALHLRIHSGEKPYSCEKCNMKFRLKCQRDRHHIKAHIKGFALKEPKKVQLIKVFNSYDEDKISISNYQIFECYLCSLTFSNKRLLLKLHMKEKHTGEKVFQCKTCFKKLLDKYTFQKHIQTHSIQFECQICGKGFARKEGLTIHMQFHTGSFNYKCNFCSKQFSKKYNLNIHVRIHTGTKPFKCEICEKRFVKRSDLVRHARTHTGERPFRCNMCQMAFTRNHLLS
ncbi:zinc finger protein OZF-like, partial [Contarinia nasturtii]|uniref:zinc finger protein OZF-like n=1 Tax=Contarinia nasturtii TaxID=265458 RepID=UPI0012D37CC5